MSTPTLASARARSKRAPVSLSRQLNKGVALNNDIVDRGVGPGDGGPLES